MANTVRVHITDMEKALHTRLKVAAAKAGVPLKEWVKAAIREKLTREEKKS